MRRSFLPALLLAAAALAGCELTEVATSPTEEVLVVEGVLVVGEPLQRVLLHRSLHSGEAAAVAGAEVSVATRSGRVVPFRLAPHEACAQGEAGEHQETAAAHASCYLSPAEAGAWVVPGEAYELTVRTPEGKVVRGRTTVPGAFRLVSPGLPASGAFTCRIPPRTSFPLAWTVAEGTWIYLTVLVVHGLDRALAGAGIEAPERLELAGVVVSARDTTLALPAGFGVFDRLDLETDLALAIRDGFPEGTRLEVLVAAADRNYANSRRGGGFNPSGSVRLSSVVGDGVGYFGSLAPHRLGIVVTGEAGTHPPCAPAP